LFLIRFTFQEVAGVVRRILSSMMLNQIGVATRVPSRLKVVSEMHFALAKASTGLSVLLMVVPLCVDRRCRLVPVVVVGRR
jgi:hypothetical protein